MSARRPVPKFKSEADEAKWVFRHQSRLAEAFESPDRPSLTVEQVLAKSRAKRKGPLVTVELSAADLARSRQLATDACLAHELYLKQLLHKAITQEAQRLS